MYFNRSLMSFVLMLPAMLLVACAAPIATTAPTLAPDQATATLQPTAAPTETLRPSLTPPPAATPTITETLPPTATLPPTPDPVLSNVKFIGLSWKSNYDLLLSFQFSEPVDPQKYRVTLEEKEYTCVVIAQFPNRLYCYGQGAKVLAVATVRVYPAESNQVGFEKDVWIPYFE